MIHMLSARYVVNNWVLWEGIIGVARAYIYIGMDIVVHEYFIIGLNFFTARRVSFYLVKVYGCYHRASYIFG